MLSTAILRKTRGFTQQKSLQHAAVLFSGKAGVYLIALLSQPILARLYSPAEFGEFAFLNSVLAITMVAASGRYEAGIILTRKPQNAKRLFQLSQLILIGYVVFISLSISLAPENFLQWISDQGLSSPYVWLIPILILFTGYWELVHNWLVRFQEYSKISFSLVFQRVLILGGALIAVVLPIPGNGLIFGLCIGSLGIFIVALLIRREPIRLPLKSIKAYGHHFKEFPFFSLPSLYILLFIQHLPVLWISHFSNQSLTGSYSMAFTVVMLPLTGLMMSAGQVYYQRISQSQLAEQPEIIRKYLTAFLLLLGPFSFFIFFWGEPLTIWLLGEKWQQAGYIASLLAPLGLFQGLSSCLTISLTPFRLQNVSLMLQLLKLLFFGLALGAGYFFQDIFLSFKLLSVGGFLHLLVVSGVMVPIFKKKYRGVSGSRKKGIRN